ncbi:anoctamin-7-like isoform X3 [Symsagittifera roscoffensis]|uniref:anoctamin-7-like isoform X3 n=1 Tax=Symsagittifera roscoffensis TaxID=84072 RepID=UPI00307C47BC
MEVSFADGNSFITPSSLHSDNQQQQQIQRQQTNNQQQQQQTQQAGFKSWVTERIQLLQSSTSSNNLSHPSSSNRKRQNGFTSSSKKSAKLTSSNGSESSSHRNEGVFSKWTRRFQNSSRGGKHAVILFKEEIVFRNLDPATYFEDNKRKIDFVLVYETKGSTSEKDTEKRRKAGRDKFFSELERQGLQLEEVIDEDGQQHCTVYVKVHVPFEVLCLYAEELNMRAPLQLASQDDDDIHGVTIDSHQWSARLWSRILPCVSNPMLTSIPHRPPDYFTCPFKKDKISKYHGSDQQQTFFTVRHRIRIAYEILQNTYYGTRSRAEIGVNRMVQEKYFTAAYPPHDGSYHLPEYFVPEEHLNARQILYKYWASWGMWYRYQPLDHVREYFGEKIAIYFAWLGFYTAWLLPAALVGLIVFVLSVISLNHNPVAQQVCDEDNSFNMCPLCDACATWKLSENCLNSWLAYLFDNGYTVFFAVFVSFWSVLFLEYWKRTSAVLAHHWDVFDFAPLEENPRPQYAALSTEMRKNPITNQLEPYFPERVRTARMISGISVLFMMIMVVIIFVAGVVIYRSLIVIPLLSTDLFRSQASLIASASGAAIQVILIMLSAQVYEFVAERFNDWEMHRTQEEYDNNLTFKVFVFQFINYYSSIIYIAFFKGKFTGYPGHYGRIFDIRLEDCPNGDCLMEMATQLAVIMVGKQIINNTMEIGLPMVKKWWNKWMKMRWRTTLGRRGGTNGNPQSMLNKEGVDSTSTTQPGGGTAETSGAGANVKTARLEEDYMLPENEGLFEEYLEMVLQFGFITIFVCAFPLAPLFALLNNWLEIRVDANKYVCQVRRAVAERANNIGIWYEILAAISRIAVITNAFLIAFTSDFMEKTFYSYTMESDLEGYVNFTLSVAPTEFDQKHPESAGCSYKGFRDSNGELTINFWKILAIKLAFMIMFEHFVFMVGVAIDVFVPDIPEDLDLKIKRERFLARQALSHIPEKEKIWTEIQD